MRKPEQKMWDRIRPTFLEKAKDVARMETGATKLGVPDLYVLMDGWAMWVELKVGEVTDGMLDADVRKSQALWARLHEWLPHGPNCHVLVWEPRLQLYYHTASAALISALSKGPVDVTQLNFASDVRVLSSLWRRP